jgi:nicotinate-nucleotide pyrophosphorylase (carboxylating)
MQPPPQKVVASDVTRALNEDLGPGDCTAALIPADQAMATLVRCREDAILCGQPWFDETFHQVQPGVEIDWQLADGDTLEAGHEVCRLEGLARGILSGERTALNFLQTLSGTATRTRQYVDAVAGTGAIILDTRKTLPGMRVAQKYAVRCGGGSNHRMGLYDAVLIKENHIAAAGSISAALSEAKRLYPDLLLEVEAETLEQIEQSYRAGAQRVLLDNFSLELLNTAVDRYKGRISLEASGGITLQTVREIAETGVDFISTGEISKSVQSVDFSMRFVA